MHYTRLPAQCSLGESMLGVCNSSGSMDASISLKTGLHLTLVSPLGDKHMYRTPSLLQVLTVKELTVHGQGITLLSIMHWLLQN